MTRLRLPSIADPSAQGQTRQIWAYLRYLAQAINELLDELEAEGGTA